MFSVKTSTVKLNNGSIDYVVFGKGSRDLVIIPGLSFRDVKGAGLGLAYTFRMFAKDFRVYVLDKNSVIEEGCTVSDIAEHTAEAMKAIGITQADIYGVSLGGMVAQYLALNYPEKVRSLVLGVTLSRQNETVKSVVGNWISLAENGDYGGIVRNMLTVMYSESYVKKYGWMFPVLTRFCIPKNRERFVRLAKACLTCDTFDRLDEIKCPALVLGGAKDLIVTGEASVEIADRLGCERYMYDSLGHSAYDEAKDFNKRIFDFLIDTVGDGGC